jgi:serine/threonine protein kinase, bacterial
MLVSKVLKANLVLFSLFLSLIASPVDAKTGSGKATETEISLVDGIALDKKGNIYIAMREHNIISRIDTKGMMSRYVGSGESGFSGDGGPAIKASLRIPAGLAFDLEGNLYIADRENHRVRKVDTSGNISTFAGIGKAGFSGDGGPAVKARLNLPSGVVADKKGNLYISDRSNDRIRVVDKKGVIRTYAGSGVAGFQGDAGPALKAQLDKPFGITLDKTGNLYIADRNNNRVRKVSSEGIITTVAGDGGFFFMGDNGPAYRASVAAPTGVAVDSKGNLYIADRNNNRIRVVDKLGMIRTVVGTGQQDYNGDSEAARETNLYLPFTLTVDSSDKLLVVDRSHYRIRRIDPKNGKVETVAGNGVKLFAGDGGPATGATLSFPHGMSMDKKDNLIFSDKGHFRIRRITPEGIINTIGGNGIRGNVGDNIPALEANFYNVTTIAQNPKGDMYMSSPSGFVSLIRKLDAKGFVHDFMDTASPKYLESIKKSKYKGLVQTGAVATITQFSDIVFDPKGNLFISDRLNHQIRKIDTEGNISTIAGTGDSDHDGDGGPALEATFRDPNSLASDKNGNIYVADTANNLIRKIDTNGIVTTFAGNGEHTDSGDGGPALKAGIRSMDDIEFSPAGELHILGTNTHKVRKITKNGKIVTIAGKGYSGFFGDGGPATKAMLKNPAAISFDSKGNLYIADMGSNRIRKVDTRGIITTFAGTGSFGWGRTGETVEIYLQNFP